MPCHVPGSVCLFVYMYVYMYVYICVYVYIYIYVKHGEGPRWRRGRLVLVG